MASQIDAAQRRAEAMVSGWKKRVNETIIDNHYSPTTFHGEMMADIAEALQQARRDALEEAKQIAKDELFNTMILLSFPEQSSAAWTIMWKLDRLREGQ